MKIVTASNGKKKVKMSKNEWQSIGKKAGWMKKAFWDDTDDLENLGQQESWEHVQGEMESARIDELLKEGICPDCEQKSLNEHLECKNPECDRFVHDKDDLPEGF